MRGFGLTVAVAAMAAASLWVASAQTTDGPFTEAQASAGRPLRSGDGVRKGQLLAVVWSKDLGEKKLKVVSAEYHLHSGKVEVL